MTILSATSNTPFVDTKAVDAYCSCCNIGTTVTPAKESASCYGTEELFEDCLEVDLVDPPADNLTPYFVLSSLATAASTEQLQELKYKRQQLKNHLNCSHKLEIKREEQQEPYLLPDMFSKNIFNSHASMFVCSDIPQISSVQSFVGAESFSYVTDASLKESLQFFGSKIGISLDSSVQDSSPYEFCPELVPPFSVCPAAKLDSLRDLAVPTTSLEAVVDFKRKIFPLRQQRKIEILGSLYECSFLASKFLDHSLMPLVRGRNFGGNNCRPPKNPLISGTQYVAARLRLEHSACEDMCLPEWNEYELEDSRRIIRIERRYDSNKIVASFSIVGSAAENPETRRVSNPDVKVLEVSCLKCLTNHNESDEEKTVDESAADEEQHCVTEPLRRSFNNDLDRRTHKMPSISTGCNYYITSVEVIKLVELLVGSYSTSDPQQRRKERGRMRSNLAHFWSKHLVSSSKNTMKRFSLSTCNNDYLAELEHRINSYDVRKPRLFDKSVKIMEWSKLGPALRRAIQSYYMVRLEGSCD